MNFFNKIKLFLENFLENNKGVVMTLFILFLLVLLCNSTTVEAHSGYTEVEYIESTGSQYINTGINSASDIEFEIKYNHTNYTSADLFSVILGGRESYSYEAFMFFNMFSQNLNNKAFWLSSNESTFTTNNTHYQTDTIVKYKDNTVTITSSQGEDIYTVPEVTSFEGACPISLFGSLRGRGGVVFELGTQMKLYYCKIWKAGELVRDFIPCLDENNTACLFDNVSDTFFYNQGTDTFIAGAEIKHIDPVLQLNINPTGITQDFVTIKTQEFSKEILNNYKCYYSYSTDVNGNDVWYIADTSVAGYYYTYALENGTYKFRLENSEGTTVSAYSLTITNIIPVTDAQDSSVLKPIIYLEPSSTSATTSQILIKTQTFNSDLINRYRCFWWTADETINEKKEALPNKNENNEYYFQTVTSENQTFYFIFYDKEMEKYSEIVNINVDVEEVMTNPMYGGTQTISQLLKYKFGIFYSSVEFIKEFWEVIVSEPEKPPEFYFTMPDFLGGGTYAVFGIEVYDEFRGYVHYIMAGFIYYAYIKRLTRTIPALINEVGG